MHCFTASRHHVNILQHQNEKCNVNVIEGSWRKHTVMGVNVVHIDIFSMIFSSIFLSGKCSLL